MMKSVHNFYYICEDGHLTVGDTRRKDKCSHIIQIMKLEKGKRAKQFDPIEYKNIECGKKIIETHDIPTTLSLYEKWKHRDMHAFLIDQKIDTDFMLTIQEHIASLYNDLHNNIKEQDEKS